MFNVIVARSLFQDFEKYADDSEEIKSFKMHDIVNDFAQFVRRSGRVVPISMVNKTIWQSCDPSLISNVNEFCSLSYKDDAPPVTLCDCLLRLRVLRFVNCGLQNIPRGIEKLIHLRLLKLENIDTHSVEDLKHISLLYNLQTLMLECCELEEIPREIGNLINLRLLKLTHNESLNALPSEIGNLINLSRLKLTHNKSVNALQSEIGNLMELRHLDLSYNDSLRELPESICGLKKLRTLKIGHCRELILPEKLAHLTGLQCLDTIEGGSGRTKLGLVKKLIHLSGDLRLHIRLAAGSGEFEKVVEDAREAELTNKTPLKGLAIVFEEEMDETESRSCKWMDIIKALEPHQNLQWLSYRRYNGLKFREGWMVSPLNQLREFKLVDCNRLTSLPCLGMLPCLEQIHMEVMPELQFVGREFLGITNTPTCVVFPKLKKLSFFGFTEWKEWEDITAEEEESAAFSIMPCLKELKLVGCPVLTALPHSLLRKASSLEIVTIFMSETLQWYGNKDDSDAKLVSQNNPLLRLSYVP